MTVEKTPTPAGPVRIDPERHREVEADDKFGLADPIGPVGPESPEEQPEPISSILSRFFEKIFETASPKDRPNVVVLGGDEQAQRLVSDTALVELAAEISRFVTSGPRRVEVAPSEAFSTERTTVGTATPAQRIVGRQADRLRLRIRNLEAADGNSVFVGAGLETTIDSGYEVPANSELVVETRAPVYAIAETATVAIQILAEFGDPTRPKSGE
jgi:hypothetical protein